MNLVFVSGVGVAVTVVVAMVVISNVILIRQKYENILLCYSFILFKGYMYFIF